MTELLTSIDNSVFLFFNGFHSPFFDRFWMLFTGRFIWIPMYASLLFMMFKAFKPKMIAVYVLAMTLAIVLTDQTCATFIRPIVERLRPANPENPISTLTHIVDGYRGGMYGFPSCHAANSFALATFMALLFPRRRFVLFIFLWATLNSYSRLYLGVHYPGDLFVGACIGSLFGFLCYRVAQLFDKEHRSLAFDRLRKPLFSLGAHLRLQSGQGALTISAADAMACIMGVTFLVICAFAIGS